MQSSGSTTSSLTAAGHGVLAVLRADGGDERTVAAAARLAAPDGGPWHAILVENAQTRRRGEAARLRTLELLREAQARGAVTAVLEGPDPAAVAAGYARRHGCATAVLAR